jgi:AcrR family transcriptional regulator
MSRAQKRVKARRIPVQERSRFTVDVILEAAIRIFSQESLATVTTIKIAEKAGVSVGSLYEYFPNKESIFLKVVEMKIEDGTTQVIENLDQAGKKLRSVRGVIRQLAGAYLDLYSENEWLLRSFKDVALDIRSLLVMVERSDSRVAMRVTEVLKRFRRKTTFPEESFTPVIVRSVHRHLAQRR